MEGRKKWRDPMDTMEGKSLAFVVDWSEVALSVLVEIDIY